MGERRVSRRRVFQQPRPRVGIEKGGEYARYKIIAASFPEARRLAPISGSVWCLRSFVNGVLPDSSLFQNGKQVEIITKMIFELCYIEGIIQNKGCTNLAQPLIRDI